MTTQVLKNYVHGKFVPASLPETIPVFSPATGQEIGKFQVSSPSDISQAIESAEAGFKEWSALSGTQRGRVLTQAARLIRERAKQLAQMEVLDSGKPISEALPGDIPGSADAIEYFGGIASTLHGSHVQLGSSFGFTRREPLGVCAGIGAWNYPLLIAAWKSAPALACGNSMIYKPSELTPLTSLALAEIYTEAGLPPGVFNVVLGASSVGQILSEHPRIKKVSLTGSLATGRKILLSAAQTLKPTTLELGGKSPLILFKDTPVDQAVSAALLANFYTQGEVCSNGTRVFVEEAFYDEFIEKLIPRVQKIKIGDPFLPETQMGALISQPHLQKVKGAIEKGLQEGATLLCGGNSPKWNESQSALKDGYFITPAVFVNCRDSMEIVREEIFGPVMSVLKFKSEEEVIERANHSDYGLAAGVFTQDLKRAHRVVAELQAGVCWINNFNITPVELPFGGYKQSGIGRENGLTALEHYTQLKTVYVEMGEMSSPF